MQKQQELYKQDNTLADGYSYLHFTDGETEALKDKCVTLRGFASKFESERQLSNVTTASNADHYSTVTFYSPFYISSAHSTAHPFTFK